MSRVADGCSLAVGIFGHHTPNHKTGASPIRRCASVDLKLRADRINETSVKIFWPLGRYVFGIYRPSWSSRRPSKTVPTPCEWTLKILRMFLARPARGQYVTAFQHPSPRWLSALSRFVKSQALHLGDHSLGAGSSSAAVSSSYGCGGLHHCMLRVPDNSISQDSGDRNADQSVADGATYSISLCAGVRASFPKAPTQSRQAGPQPHKTPKSIITAETESIHSPVSVC